VFYEHVGLNQEYNTLDVIPGTWYMVDLVWEYICGLGGMAMLISHIRTVRGSQRHSAFCLLMMPLMPILSNLLYESGLSPFGQLDLTPFALVLSMIFLYMAVIRHHLVDLAPVAHDVVVDQTPHGVLVFDRDRRLCEANKAARQMLLIGLDAVGHPADELLEDDLAERILPETGRTQFETLLHGVDIEVQTNILSDSDSVRLGWVVTLVDISERKRMEAQLERLLRKHGDLS
jgi:PAS domain-containing protein